MVPPSFPPAPVSVSSVTFPQPEIPHLRTRQGHGCCARLETPSLSKAFKVGPREQEPLAAPPPPALHPSPPHPALWFLLTLTGFEVKEHAQKQETPSSLPAPPQMPLPEIPQPWLVSEAPTTAAAESPGPWPLRARVWGEGGLAC